MGKVSIPIVSGWVEDAFVCAKIINSGGDILMATSGCSNFCSILFYE